MYLNICTYMSQQMQLMYTETPCFGENKWTQKITQNTRKYILRRATKVTTSKFRSWRRKKKTEHRAVFFGGSHRKKWCAPSIIFCQERWSARLALQDLGGAPGQCHLSWPPQFVDLRASTSMSHSAQVGWHSRADKKSSQEWTRRDAFKDQRVLARTVDEVHTLICEFVYVLIYIVIWFWGSSRLTKVLF